MQHMSSFTSSRGRMAMALSLAVTAAWLAPNAAWGAAASNEVCGLHAQCSDGNDCTTDSCTDEDGSWAQTGDPFSSISGTGDAVTMGGGACTGAGIVPANDCAISGAISLPFNFPLFGHSGVSLISTIYVSGKGRILPDGVEASLDNANGSANNAVSIPSSLSQISPFWDSLWFETNNTNGPNTEIFTTTVEGLLPIGGFWWSGKTSAASRPVHRVSNY